MNIWNFKVGDLVICQELDVSDNTKVLYEHVKELQPKDFATDYNGGEYVNYKPIPLTDKIIEKNGFEKGLFNWSGYAISEYLFLVDCGNFENHKYGLVSSNMEADVDTEIYIDYVHQLQELLRFLSIDDKLTI